MRRGPETAPDRTRDNPRALFRLSLRLHRESGAVDFAFPTSKKPSAATGPGPVIMVNLLKFKPKGGREAFGAYAGVTRPLLTKAGGELVYSGEAGAALAGADDRDTVVRVRFPSIDRFMDLLTDPLYQSEGRKHRRAALERTHWMVSQPHDS